MVKIKHNEIKIFAQDQALFEFAAEDFCTRALRAIETQQYFTVVLSGGNTPKAFFTQLVENSHCRTTIPWQRIQFFFTDERYVPHDSPDSNYHMASQYLFSHVPVLPENIFAIPTDFADPSIAAIQYEQMLRTLYACEDDAIPEFDLIYLGLGNDAHTASLMPQTDMVKRFADVSLSAADHSLVEAAYIDKLHMFRITLTPRILNCAKQSIFMVTGIEKASAVAAVLVGPHDPQNFPAQFIHPALHPVQWYVDKAAASKLPETE